MMMMLYAKLLTAVATLGLVAGAEASSGVAEGLVMRREIEVVNDSGVGIELYKIESSTGERKLLRRSGEKGNTTITGDVVAGAEVEIHEVCSTEESESKTCRRAVLEVTNGKEKQGVFWKLFL
jgi:hypothetical protein